MLYFIDTSQRDDFPVPNCSPILRTRRSGQVSDSPSNNNKIRFFVQLNHQRNFEEHRDNGTLRWGEDLLYFPRDLWSHSSPSTPSLDSQSWTSSRPSATRPAHDGSSLCPGGT